MVCMRSLLDCVGSVTQKAASALEAGLEAVPARVAQGLRYVGKQPTASDAPAVYEAPAACQQRWTMGCFPSTAIAGRRSDPLTDGGEGGPQPDQDGNDVVLGAERARDRL